MSIAGWSLFVGAILVALVLLGRLLGPGAFGVLLPDPARHAALLEVAAEGALLVSLFSVGLQLGVPFGDPRWRLPLRLAFGEPRGKRWPRPATARPRRPLVRQPRSSMPFTASR